MSLEQSNRDVIVDDVDEALLDVLQLVSLVVVDAQRLFEELHELNQRETVHGTELAELTKRYEDSGAALR